MIPAKVTVIQHVRPKYKCPCCEGGIKQRPQPPQPIPGSIASPAILAFIAVSKFFDHLPLYRLEGMFNRISVSLTRQTMARWMIELGKILTPLYNLLQDELLESPLIQMDETRIQVLKEKGRNPSSKSQMWVRARDGTDPIILFDYNKSRGSAVISELLSGYRGILQTDGYAAYASYCNSRGLAHAGCFAHTRRKFWEAFKASKKSKKSIAEAALALFKKLYEAEKETKDLSAAERLAYRKEHHAPILKELFELCENNVNEVPKTLKTGEAIRYTLDQWSKLILVLEDGHIPLDTNFIETRLRPFTIGRKNWMFADTPAGAGSSAMIYSILMTAKENGLEPFSYLKHVISELPKAQTLEDFQRLLPFKN